MSVFGAAVPVILLGAIGGLTLGCLPAGRSAEHAEFGAVDTVFVVPGSHLDLGFTAPLSEIRAERVAILDLAIAAAERDSAFIWFEEGGWSVEAWLDHYANQPARIDALRRLVSSGRIGIGATLLSPHAAAFPEVFGQLTIHVDRIEHQLGNRPSVAVLNDVPSAPEALLDALAAAGVRYLLVGANMTFTAPLPVELVRRPFYWESARGARILTFIDPDGFTAGYERWGLPPVCARILNASLAPLDGMDDDSLLRTAVDAQLRRVDPARPVTIVQHALDNWDPECATLLPAAVKRWNRSVAGPHFVVATPEAYFRRIEAAEAGRLPVLRGEWGGDWDMIRATEPVWSWRLRSAGRAITPTTERSLRIAFAAATDHNVGLGPRWIDGMAEGSALRHVQDVHALYRDVVVGLLGQRSLASVPAPLPRPLPQSWPTAWRTLVGEREDAVRIRAGPPPIGRLLDDAASGLSVPVEVTADEQRLLIRVRVDRAELERRGGAQHVVVEIAVRRSRDSLSLAPEGAASGVASRWLRGEPPAIIVAPDGVRISGVGESVLANGPLFINWSLEADRSDPGLTWLQAHALTHAVQGEVRAGRRRWPFGVLYPGEPMIVDFELALRRDTAADTKPEG